MALASVIPLPPQNEAPLDDSGQHSQAWSQYFEKLSSILQTTSGLRHGVTDGSDATPGDIGEYLAVLSGTVGLSTGAVATVATLTLTAGDWDVWGVVSFNAGSAGAGAHTSFGAGLDAIAILNQGTFPATAITQGIGVPAKRYNVTASTAVHLVASAAFTGGTVTTNGTVMARRIR